MAAIAPASGTDLLDLLKKSGILSAQQLASLPPPGDLPDEATKAAVVLVQRGLVTRFQATQLLQGRHKGFRIGPYTIQDLLGRGGMGAVYRAEHLELQRSVAIKILAPPRGEDPKLAVERFLREGRAAAAFDHPNIVRVFDVARHNDTPYLVMEYVNGETLQRVIDREGPMPFEAAAECVAQAAAGLQHAHEKGVIHRDIKPSNLIRDRSGVVKILDMGLARSSSDRDKLTEMFDEGAVVGTADYISPEQAINAPDVDSRADIYSLGATLYTLILGKAPFEGNTTQKLMQHQLKVPPPLHAVNPAVPEALSNVVARMLAKKPGERYQTAAEVIAAVAAWSEKSAHVLAGLSRTNFGSGDSHLGLPARAAESSRRILGQTPPRLASDSSADASGSGTPTGTLMSVDTQSDDSRVRRPRPAEKTLPPAPRSRRKLAIMAVGAAVILVGAAGVWAALSGGKPAESAKVDAPVPAPRPAPPVTRPQPEVTLPDRPKPAPGITEVAVEPTPAPPPPAPAPVSSPTTWAEGATLYKLDVAGVAEFRMQKEQGARIGGTRARLPTGVTCVCIKEGSAGEFRRGVCDRVPALGVANLNDVRGAHFLFNLEEGLMLTLQPGKAYRVKVACRAEGDAAGTVSLNINPGRRVVTSAKLQPTAEDWKTVTMSFERPATEPGESLRLTINNTAYGADNILWLRSVEIVELTPPK